MDVDNRITVGMIEVSDFILNWIFTVLSISQISGGSFSRSGFQQLVCYRFQYGYYQVMGCQ
ncbi:hypothetical protein NE671_15810, partial [Blautia sp. DFI.9.10]